MNLTPIFNVVRIPVSLLLGLTTVGLALNFLNIFIIIAAWWALTLGSCALLSGWTGFEVGKKNSLVESGVAAAIVWLVPGAVGLGIYGITQFISAVLWGAVEGYEAVAFLIGGGIILVMLAFGAVISFAIGMFGGWLGKTFAKSAGPQQKKRPKE